MFQMTVKNMRQRDKFSQKHSKKKKKSKILSAGEITELASKALIPGISSSSHMVLNLK